MTRFGAILSSATTLPADMLAASSGGGGALSVLNSSGTTAAVGDVGYLDVDGSYKTTTTANLIAQWCVVISGGANATAIGAARRGAGLTVNYTGTAPAAGHWLTTSTSAGLAQRSTYCRPEVFAVCTSAGSGGTVTAQILTHRVALDVFPAADLLGITGHGGTDFVATISTVGSATTETFTTPGTSTWTCPAGVTSVQIECWGGGGGGGTGGSNGGGGGGGGAYSIETAFTSTPTTGYSYTVGAGGAAGSAGGDTSFNTTTCKAKGGNGAATSFGGTGGAAGSGTGDTKYSGGDGASAAGGAFGAGGGSSAGTGANGNNGADGSPGLGGAAVTGGGAGGDGGVEFATNGVAGSAPGGGGGGEGGDGSDGGAGANGKLVLSYTATGATLVYNAPSSGNEAAIKPSNANQLGKLVLFNTTRGDSALIDSVDTGTNTITLTGNVPGTWQAGDTITCRSQTNAGNPSQYFFDVDLSAADNDTIPANAVSVTAQFDVVDSSGAGKYLLRHPWASYAPQQAIGVSNPASGVYGDAAFSIPLINRRFTVLCDAAGATSASFVMRVLSVIVAAP